MPTETETTKKFTLFVTFRHNAKNTLDAFLTGFRPDQGVLEHAIGSLFMDVKDCDPVRVHLYGEACETPAAAVRHFVLFTRIGGGRVILPRMRIASVESCVPELDSPQAPSCYVSYLGAAGGIDRVRVQGTAEALLSELTRSP